MNAVTYTKTGDNLFSLLANGANLGTVARVEGNEPAKRDGKTRKTTQFTFTPAEGVELKGVSKATMKELKEAVAAELPAPTEEPAGESLPIVDEANDGVLE